jgi:hypothetical protein
MGVMTTPALTRDAKTAMAVAKSVAGFIFSGFWSNFQVQASVSGKRPNCERSDEEQLRRDGIEDRERCQTSCRKGRKESVGSREMNEQSMDFDAREARIKKEKKEKERRAGKGIDWRCLGVARRPVTLLVARELDGFRIETKRGPEWARPGQSPRAFARGST